MFPRGARARQWIQGFLRRAGGHAYPAGRHEPAQAWLKALIAARSAPRPHIHPEPKRLPIRQRLAYISSCKSGTTKRYARRFLTATACVRAEATCLERATRPDLQDFFWGATW